MSPFYVSAFANSANPEINNSPQPHLTAGIDGPIQLEILPLVRTCVAVHILVADSTKPALSKKNKNVVMIRAKRGKKV